jgi:hypothetical protein
MVKGKSLEVVDVAVGRVRRRKWKGVVIEGHPTTAERAGRNKKGRTKGRRGDGLRQGEHEAKGTRRRYVTLRLRQSERSERSETSTKDKISGPTAELPLQRIDIHYRSPQILSIGLQEHNTSPNLTFDGGIIIFESVRETNGKQQ